MILPSKHIRFAESLMGLGGILLSIINEPKTIDEISIKTGIDTDHLQPFLDALLKEKSLVKDGEKYHKKN